MSITRRFIAPIIVFSPLVGLAIADDRQPFGPVELNEQQEAIEGSEATPQPTPGIGMEPRLAGPVGAPPAVPRWLDEVRAQRRALREQRRAAHQARQHALDPIGAAKRDERQEQMRRRQEEVRERIETERRLYLNRGPWLNPLVPAPPYSGGDPLTRGSLIDEPARMMPEAPPPGTDSLTPSDWNNLWYYRGW